MSELGDLLELLHGARHRYRTLRATVRDWYDAELSERAWMREDGGGTLVAVGPPGDDEEEPEPPGSETITRLWWDPAGRVRQERGEGPEREVNVVVGERWWSYQPGHGAVSNAEDLSIGHGAAEPHPELFDPARFLGLVDLEPLGPATQAGRPALRARARPRELEDSLDRYLPLGADSHELVVDAEHGILLRLASLTARSTWSPRSSRSSSTWTSRARPSSSRRRPASRCGRWRRPGCGS